jgi:hypothetical protein
MVAFGLGSANPLANPFGAERQQQFDYQGTVLYRGTSSAAAAGGLCPRVYPGNDPEVVWFTGRRAGMAGVKLYRNRGGLQNPSLLLKGIFLLLFSIVFPIALVVLEKSVLYDGARHFIFVLPPLACLAGIAMQGVSDWLEGVVGFDTLHRTQLRSVFDRLDQRRAAVALALAVAVLAGNRIYTMARLYPTNIPTNSLVGGEGAYQNYETDYWGLATSEAVRWLEDI